MKRAMKKRATRMLREERAQPPRLGKKADDGSQACAYSDN